MNIKTCEKKEKNEYQIIVEITPEEFETAINDAFKKNRKSISVPGFRRGKAPRKIVESMYGASVFHPDALDMIAPDVLDFAHSEADLKTVGHPNITDVDIRDDKGVEVTIMTAIYPEVKLGEYKGLSAVKNDAQVAEEAIDAEIESVRSRNARFDKAERPAVHGDITIIDFDGYVDGEQFEGGKAEGYELELGSKAFIPGFEDQVVGMSPGEERDIELVFPKEYTPELAEKPVVFKVKLHEIKDKILPELDDEFAKDVSEFDTLEEYRADIRDRLAKVRQSDVDASFESALLEQVIEKMEVEVPDAMIEEQMDASMSNFAQQIRAYGMEPAQYLQMMGATPEAFRETMRESSEKQIKVMLALEAIAEAEAIEAAAEEIEKEYAEAAERYNMEIEKLKESVPAERLAADIKSKHAMKLVVDNAVALDPPAPDKEDADIANAVVKAVSDSDEKPEKKEKAKAEAKPKKPAAKKTATAKKKADTKEAQEDKKDSSEDSGSK